MLIVADRHFKITVLWLTFLKYLQPTDKEPATPSVPDTPQVAIFVSYVHPPKVPVRISVLGEMVRIELLECN